jgi:hypothetical protein
LKNHHFFESNQKIALFCVASGFYVFEKLFFFISLDAAEVGDKVLEYHLPYHIGIILIAFSKVYAGKKNNELDIIAQRNNNISVRYLVGNFIHSFRLENC